MFSLTSSFRYYLYREPTDMRRSFDGLSGIVQGQLERNPTSGEVFIFINRRRNKVKLLRWEQGGFILYYKRLEQGTFELPKFEKDSVSYRMSWSGLMLMIEGISIEKSKQRRRYVTNNYQVVS
ncbi:MAG: IS66 family insertion sequence element accessory protein TnpB [Bacteroidota bacterium]|nr:IS66 family insertion sequence element accessory protein TnpB [Bacteroidota bacterium]